MAELTSSQVLAQQSKTDKKLVDIQESIDGLQDSVDGLQESVGVLQSKEVKMASIGLNWNQNSWGMTENHTNLLNNIFSNKVKVVSMYFYPVSNFQTKTRGIFMFPLSYTYKYVDYNIYQLAFFDFSSHASVLTNEIRRWVLAWNPQNKTIEFNSKGSTSDINSSDVAELRIYYI